MNLLSKYLKKLGVSEFSQLSEDEKETYRSWDNILSGRKLTDEDVARFLDTELNDVLGKLTDPKTEGRADVFLKMKLEMITKIKTFLASPQLEKAMLEENINQLLK